MKNWGMPDRAESGPVGPHDVPNSANGPTPTPSSIPAHSGGGLEDFENPVAARASETKVSGKAKRWTIKDWEDAMQALFERLNKGLDFNDPRTQSILNNARNSTMQSANDHGVYGGYSENAAEGSYIKSAAGLQSQQDMMALQALNMGSNYSRGVAQDKYQADMNQFNMDQQKNDDWWSNLGGGIGALGGGVLGGIAGMAGGPLGVVAGAASGASGGWNAGRGIGGSFGHQFGPQNLPSYSDY